MTQDELKLVLDALKFCHGGEPCGTAEVIAVVEKLLAQPEHEPVKVLHKHEWFRTNEMKVGQMRCISCGVWGHEEAPQRTWVGLTNDELTDLFYNTNLGQESAVFQAIALLKERNT